MITELRAFDKVTERTFYVESINFKEKVVNLGGCRRRYFHEVETMQFTGLYDKNGDEIFEGDIVREFGNDYTFVYTNGVYMALHVQELKHDKKYRCFSTQANIVVRSGCYIVGNIYENPELLDG